MASTELRVNEPWTDRCNDDQSIVKPCVSEERKSNYFGVRTAQPQRTQTHTHAHKRTRKQTRRTTRAHAQQHTHARGATERKLKTLAQHIVTGQTHTPASTNSAMPMKNAPGGVRHARSFNSAGVCRADTAKPGKLASQNTFNATTVPILARENAAANTKLYEIMEALTHTHTQHTHTDTHTHTTRSRDERSRQAHTKSLLSVVT
jgi:hypothetical protein